MVQLVGSMGNGPDADEAPDMVELVGFVAADMTTGHNADRMVPIEPDQCLGFMCPAKSDACADCGIAKREAELFAGYEGNHQVDVEDGMMDVKDEYLDRPIVSIAFDDDAYDKYASAPRGRGIRARLAFARHCSSVIAKAPRDLFRGVIFFISPV